MAAQHLFTHTQRDGDGRRVATLAGEFDRASIASVVAHVGPHDEPVDRFDLRLVTLFGAAAFTALLHLQDDRPTELVASRAVRRVTRICALPRSFVLRDDDVDFEMDRAPFGFALLDEDLRFVDVNASLAAIHGAPVVAHLGRRPDQLFVRERDDCAPIVRRVHETDGSERHLVDAEIAGRSGTFTCDFYSTRVRGRRLVASLVVRSRVRAETSRASRRLVMHAAAG